MHYCCTSKKCGVPRVTSKLKTDSIINMPLKIFYKSNVFLEKKLKLYEFICFSCDTELNETKITLLQLGLVFIYSQRSSTLFDGCAIAEPRVIRQLLIMSTFLRLFVLYITIKQICQTDKSVYKF